MQITDISITKKGRYSLFSGDEFLCSLHPEIFLRSGIHKGMELESKKLGELWQESEYRITKDRALKLLSIKSYTSGQMMEKLKRYADEEICEQVIIRMQELGLMDDLDYARRYAHDLAELKSFAPRRIRMELRRRGLSEDIIDEAMTEWEENDRREKAAAVLIRRYPNFKEDEKVKKRVENALLRMGYSYEDIRDAMREAEE